MTWFKVDDGFHSHSKTRKVLAKAPSALALWVVAGSWSSDKLTDGFVPDDQLPWLVPQGAEEMARQLVAARFWKRVRGGYQFHEWAEDNDGTKRNPTREDIEALRRAKAQAGRKGGIARSKSLSSSRNGSSTGQARATAPATDVLDPPTRPDPFLGGALSAPVTTARTQPQSPPDPRCPEHLDTPSSDPCGPCGDARRTRTRWDMAEAERQRTAPRCRHHRGQPAHNCAPCRAEALAAPEES